MTENSDDFVISAEIVEELTEDELADRHRLEMRVERSFVDAGKALVELRNRRLYRNTHKTWEAYCQDRFGYSYRFVNFKITSADVFENLVNHFSESDLGTNCSQKILPTRESQCRELAKIEPEQQPEAWQKAIARTPGKKVPAASTVKEVVKEMKGIVDHLKEKHPSPPEFAEGDVVEIRATKHSPVRPFDGMWAVVEHVGSYSYTVRIGIAKEVQHCQEGEMKKIEDEYAEDIKAVGERIAALVEFELEAVEYAILEQLQRSKCFTPTQLQLLDWLEQKHFG